MVLILLLPPFARRVLVVTRLLFYSRCGTLGPDNGGDPHRPQNDQASSRHLRSQVRSSLVVVVLSAVDFVLLALLSIFSISAPSCLRGKFDGSTGVSGDTKEKQVEEIRRRRESRDSLVVAP